MFVLDFSITNEHKISLAFNKLKCLKLHIFTSYCPLSPNINNTICNVFHGTSCNSSGRSKGMYYLHPQVLATKF